MFFEILEKLHSCVNAGRTCFSQMIGHGPGSRLDMSWLCITLRILAYVMLSLTCTNLRKSGINVFTGLILT
jgi:hypothetical protein